jgi:hypothetical protein
LLVYVRDATIAFSPVQVPEREGERGPVARACLVPKNFFKNFQILTLIFEHMHKALNVDKK